MQRRAAVPNTPVDKPQLLSAARNGHVQFLTDFLDRNCDPNWCNEDGDTALHLAVANGKIDAVRVLLARNADVDLRNKAGQTALHIAASINRDDIVELLFKYDAKSHIQDGQGETALHVAAAKGHHDVINRLASRTPGKVDQTNLHGDTALHKAALFGHLKTVEVLLKHANPNLQNKSNNTPLHYAVQIGRVDVVKALLAKKADANKIGSHSRSPLYEAVHQDYFPIAKELQNNGARCDLQNFPGDTPLHHAARTGRFNFVQLFLTKTDIDFNPDKLDEKSRRTALDSAMEKNHTKIAFALITAGAVGNLDIFKNFVERHPNIDRSIINYALYNAVRNNDKKTFEFLLEKKADVHVKNRSGQTLLHVAAEKGYLEIASKLLTHNPCVDINARDKNNNTALHLAAANKRTDVVELLLKQGAKSSISIRNKSGQTPAMIAGDRNSRNQIAFFKLTKYEKKLTERPEEHKPRFSFLAWLGILGYSKTDKLAAVKAYRRSLESNVPLDPKHYGALTNGRLDDKIKELGLVVPRPGK